MQLQNTLLPFIEINPTTNAMGSVIWLHGLGADGSDFAPIVPELHLPHTIPLRFIFPHAPSRPVTINNGYVMPAWYDITSMGINHQIDRNGIAISVKQIMQLIEHEENLGIPSENIVLAGFSQGAVIALNAGLSATKPLAGIMALSGYLPFADEIAATTIPRNRNIPIFIAHGKEDTIVPYQAGLLTYDTLKAHALSATWHSYSMAHSVCNKEIEDIAKWLQDIFKSKLVG